MKTVAKRAENVIEQASVSVIGLRIRFARGTSTGRIWRITGVVLQDPSLLANFLTDSGLLSVETIEEHATPLKKNEKIVDR